MKSDAVCLRYVLECIRRIEENTAKGRETFLSSHTLQDAVLRNLQTMAETTQRLSDTVRSTRQDIEWHKIAAFRNVLVHGYLGIDLEQVWEITQRDVSKLKEGATFLLKSIEAGGSDEPEGTQ